jgi:hypothetical protein
MRCAGWQPVVQFLTDPDPHLSSFRQNTTVIQTMKREIPQPRRGDLVERESPDSAMAGAWGPCLRQPAFDGGPE